MKISACMITKNEEKNIARCMNSYKDIVDEIIVVDSESTDDTVRIAESLGAKVYTRPWTNDFAAAKNYAIDKASGEWIIFLDADEYLGKGQAITARKLMRQMSKQPVDTILISLYDICGSETDIMDHAYQERIFKNRPELRYVNPIHESLLSGGKIPQRHIAESLKAYHTGYDPDRITEKVRRNLEILKNPDVKMHDPLRHKFYLVSSYNRLGMHKEAIDEANRMFGFPEFLKSVEERYNLFTIYRYVVTSMLALQETYKETQVMEVLEKIPENLKRHPDIKHLKAECLKVYGRIDEAIRELEEAIWNNENEELGYANAFSLHIAAAYAELAALYKFRNKSAKAAVWLENALKKDRMNEVYLCEWLHVAAKREIGTRQRFVDSIYDLNIREEVVRIARCAWTSGNDDLFSILFLHMIKKWPEETLSDKADLCRIFLLQNNYEGILQLANQDIMDQTLSPFAFIACMVGRQAVPEEFEIDFGFACYVIRELLQSKKISVLDCFLQSTQFTKLMEQDKKNTKIQCAVIFEKHQRWLRAAEFYEEAAQHAHIEKEKGDILLAAAHMHFCAGNGQKACIMLEEVERLTKQESHLPQQIRMWSRE